MSDESRTRWDEQRRKYSKTDISQRISWLGHLERMEEDRMPKKIFTQALEGTRRRGRPRKRWKEEVERDLQVLGVRKWRPKPTVGCNANGRKKRRRRRRRKTYLLFAYFLFYQKVAHSFDIQRITYAELGFIFLINVFGVWWSFMILWLCSHDVLFSSEAHPCGTRVVALGAYQRNSIAVRCNMVINSETFFLIIQLHGEIEPSEP